MPNVFYQKYKPRAETAGILGEILDVVDDYAAQGFTLTLRQLYYQLVSQDLIRNEEKQYKRIGDIVSKARRGGILDWDALEDRVRVPSRPPEFSSLDDLIEAALASYRLPRLKGQDTYVELWVEKDALAGVLQPIARRYHITLMVNRGYSSTSAMREAGVRIRTSCRENGCRRAQVLYLGDLDPSGEDMVRDVGERLDEYTNRGVVFNTQNESTVVDEEASRILTKPYIRVKVQKIALTMDQVEEYDPPPNPAKLSDSRAAKFVEKYGYSSWEVDALPPKVLRQIIEEELDNLIDSDLVQRIKNQEADDKLLLVNAVETLRRAKD